MQSNFWLKGRLTKKQSESLEPEYIYEHVLQDMIDKLIEIGGFYGVEMNVEKTNAMRISRQPFPVKSMIDQNN